MRVSSIQCVKSVRIYLTRPTCMRFGICISSNKSSVCAVLCCVRVRSPASTNLVGSSKKSNGHMFIALEYRARKREKTHQHDMYIWLYTYAAAAAVINIFYTPFKCRVIYCPFRWSVSLVQYHRMPCVMCGVYPSSSRHMTPIQLRPRAGG